MDPMQAKSRAAGSGEPHPPLTFLMAGCQRCGSTWVDKALRGHPEIFLPERKQTYFFDETYHKGIDWYLDQFTAVRPEHKAVGEISTGYCLPHAVPRMAAHFPDIRVMMAVRNPAERAYSYFQSRSVHHGWPDFETAVAAEPAILERGRYIEQIEALLEHYPRDRLLLLFYDDLKRDDGAYLRSILEFLGVDPDYRSPRLGQVVQTAAFPKLRRRMRRLGLEPVMDRVSASPAGDWLRRRIKKAGGSRYRVMPADLRARLVDYYAPYNERLAAFAGRDLSHWNV